MKRTERLFIKDFTAKDNGNWRFEVNFLIEKYHLSRNLKNNMYFVNILRRNNIPLRREIKRREK